MVFTVVAAICFVVAVPLAAPAVGGVVALATTVTAVGSAASVAAVAAARRATHIWHHRRDGLSGDRVDEARPSGYRSNT